MVAGIKHGDDDCAIRLDKIVNSQIAFRNERPVIQSCLDFEIAFPQLE
jgi:hypothetical protein